MEHVGVRGVVELAPRMRPVLLRYDQGRRRVFRRDVGVVYGPATSEAIAPKSRRCRGTDNHPEVDRPRDEGPKSNLEGNSSTPRYSIAGYVVVKDKQCPGPNRYWGAGFLHSISRCRVSVPEEGAL
jgi:hypothetical protein